MGDHLLSPQGSPARELTPLQRTRGRGRIQSEPAKRGRWGSPIGVDGSNGRVSSPFSYSSQTLTFPIPNPPNRQRDSCLLHPDTLLPMTSFENVPNHQDTASMNWSSSECLLDSFMRDSLWDMQLDAERNEENEQKCAPTLTETKMLTYSSVTACSAAANSGGDEPSKAIHAAQESDRMHTAETDEGKDAAWATTQGARAFSGVPDPRQEQQGEMMLQILLQVMLAHSAYFDSYVLSTSSGTRLFVAADRCP